MSTGMVVCSSCRRVVHQDSWGRGAQRGWYHCEDETPRCEGATSDYPKAAADVRGYICESDGPLPAGETD